MSTHLRQLVLLLGLSGCLREVGPGPFLGDCARYPEGTWTFGEIGIGTCMAGPADVQFINTDGRSWLAITNADPFRNYTAGSLLLLDPPLEANDGERVLISDVEAHALEMESFVGGIGFDPASATAIITSRLSPDSYTQVGLDRAWLVDLNDPTDLKLRSDRAFVSVRQDPYAVGISSGRAWIANTPAASISVLDTTANPPDLLDPAPPARVTDLTFTDADASGSNAESVVTILADESLPTTDVWTASWVDGTARAWVSGPDGLSRYSSGGAGWIPSGFGVELGGVDSPDLAGLSDPWLVANGTQLAMYFVTDGVIRRALTDTFAGLWSLDPFTALSGSSWYSTMSGPALVELDSRQYLYFDGSEGGGPSAIGLATSIDGTRFTTVAEPIVTAESALHSLAQPAVLFDAFTDTARMWVSMSDGERWSIGHASSANGVDGWSDVTEVLSIDGDAGAPWVAWFNGRYQMWLTVRARSDGPESPPWQHATSWSWDGLSWTEPEVWLDSAIADSGRPPRAALQVVPVNSWRLEGQDAGQVEILIPEGDSVSITEYGITVRLDSGHEVGTDLLGDLTANGVEAGSIAAPQGLQAMYITATGLDERPRLAALRELAGRWQVAAWDLLPTGSGGNVSGASSPVVFQGPDSDWIMLYAAHSVSGITTMRAATSSDGLNWTPASALPLPAAVGEGGVPGWDSASQLPHAVEVTPDGWRLWYGGFDGSRFRIGQASSSDGLRWTRLPGPDDAWTLGVGEPGTFDDSGVRDPMPATCGGVEGLWYSAFDGTTWTIGFAEQQADGQWLRRISSLTGEPAPALEPIPETFAESWVQGPVLQPEEPAGDACRVWFSGSDGTSFRIGSGLARGGDLFPTLRYATPGDALSFTTRRGEAGTSEIQLRQLIDGALVMGPRQIGRTEGPTAMAIDEGRGLLFVVAPLYPGVVVLDIRDDSTATFEDRNYLDIETVLRFRTSTNLLGFNDILLLPDGRLYLAAHEPDSIQVVNSNGIIDDDVKEITDFDALGALPIHDVTDDAGDQTFSDVGAAGLAWVPGLDLLIATQFRDNSVSVFDLSLGAYGEEIRYLPDLCENPSEVVLDPTGSRAIIACYLGAVSEAETASSLVLLDLDPSSANFLGVAARLVNQ